MYPVIQVPPAFILILSLPDGVESGGQLTVESLWLTLHTLYPWCHFQNRCLESGVTPRIQSECELIRINS
jgi:hypothetical protein